MSAGGVRALLERRGLRALRPLGQNFLVDDALAARLAELAGVEAADTVVEIGTGLGALTRALAERAARVVTVEIDAGLVRALRDEALLPPNVELLHADVLQLDLSRLVAEAKSPVRLVANLPYSISAPVLRRLLDLRGQLLDWSVMVQREVAARLRADPGSRAYGSLTVLHRLCVSLARTLELAPGCFHPAPEVRSVFLRMTPRTPAPGARELRGVERLVRAAFSQRRKTLANALRGAADLALPAQELAGALASLGIDPRSRAETVSPEQFRALARALSLHADGARA